MSRPAFNPVKPREIGTVEHCLSALIDQAGGVERVALRFDVDPSTVYAYTERKPNGAMSFAKVAALTGPGASAGAEFLALLAGGVFLPVAPEDADPITLCADDARAHGQAIAACVEALRDLEKGKAHHPKKLKVALGDLDRALRALTGLRASVITAMRVSPG